MNIGSERDRAVLCLLPATDATLRDSWKRSRSDLDSVSKNWSSRHFQEGSVSNGNIPFWKKAIEASDDLHPSVNQHQPVVMQGISLS